MAGLDIGQTNGFIIRPTLSPSAEWEISLSEWRFVRMSQGFGYWMGDSVVEELHEAEVLVIPPGATGRMRASQLGPLSFHYYDFAPEILTGFLTLAEQQYFETLGRHGRPKVRVLPATHKRSEEFTTLLAASAQISALLLRCRMLQLTAAMFAEEITLHESEMLPASSVEARFKELITEMPDGELLERTPEELGASAAALGTAFLTCPESGASDAYKRAILAARKDTTVITRAFSGRPARGLANAFISKMTGKENMILPYPLQNILTRAMRAAAAACNDTGLLSLWAGAGVARARALPAADLVKQLVEEIA